MIAQQIKEAILFYSRAQCYHHGIRLAVEHEMDSDVLTLALQAPAKLMLEASKYFEDRNKIDQAILLYHKAKAFNKAVSLCFQSGRFDQLGAIGSRSSICSR